MGTYAKFNGFSGASTTVVTHGLESWLGVALRMEILRFVGARRLFRLVGVLNLVGDSFDGRDGSAKMCW